MDLCSEQKGASTSPSLLLTRRWPHAVEDELRRHYRVTVDAQDRKLSKIDLQSAMQSFDVLCPTVSDRLDAEVLATRGARVQLIANYGAGTDHIDLSAAREAGLSVSNTPDVLTDATAELALLLMLMASRRASEGERELRNGAWSGWRPTHMLGRSLSGRMLGVVGFGRIGQATARRARALGMRIAYWTRGPVAPEAEAALDARRAPSLEALAAEADVLSLHCQAGADTHHLVDAKLLARMKSEAILVNTSRGSLVNERDLAQSLAQGRLAAAGLDVFEHEPQVEPALLGLPNAVLLPHLGSATREARVAMGLRVKANIDRFFEAQELPDRVV